MLPTLLISSFAKSENVFGHGAMKLSHPVRSAGKQALHRQVSITLGDHVRIPGAELSSPFFALLYV